MISAALKCLDAGGLRRTAARYAPFVRNAYLAMLAYRLRYFTGLVTYLVFVSVNYFVWHAVFGGRGPGAVINGFTLEEMVTYVSIGWLSRSLYFSDIDEEIDELVRTGQVSIYLLRPVDFQLLMLCQALGGTLFRASCFSLPLGVLITLVFPVAPPAGAVNLLLFAAATCASFLILAQLNFIVGLLAFFIKSVQGIVRAKYYLVQLFSGLLLPLSFFPGWLQTASSLLPFQNIAFVPLKLYLGHVGAGEALAVLFNELFWLAALFAASRALWRRALAKLTLQGG